MWVRRFLVGVFLCVGSSPFAAEYPSNLLVQSVTFAEKGGFSLSQFHKTLHLEVVKKNDEKIGGRLDEGDICSMLNTGSLLISEVDGSDLKRKTSLENVIETPSYEDVTTLFRKVDPSKQANAAQTRSIYKAIDVITKEIVKNNFLETGIRPYLNVFLAKTETNVWASDLNLQRDAWIKTFVAAFFCAEHLGKRTESETLLRVISDHIGDHCAAFIRGNISVIMSLCNEIRGLKIKFEPNTEKQDSALLNERAENIPMHLPEPTAVYVGNVRRQYMEGPVLSVQRFQELQMPDDGACGLHCFYGTSREYGAWDQKRKKEYIQKLRMNAEMDLKRASKEHLSREIMKEGAFVTDEMLKAMARVHGDGLTLWRKVDNKRCLEFVPEEVVSPGSSGRQLHILSTHDGQHFNLLLPVREWQF